MIVDLREIPILVLNVPDDVKRRDFMGTQLDKFGLEGRFVDGIRCTPRAVGCALSHLKALRSSPSPPFLVLEDDCEFFEERFRYTFEVPDEADALYLGHSSFGLSDTPDKYGLRWGRLGNVHFEPVGDQLIRVFNMVGRHAITYLSERFIEATIAAGERAMIGHDFPIPGDVEYAEIQSDHRVLAVRDPICCQSDTQGGKYLATRESIVSVSA